MKVSWETKKRLQENSDTTPAGDEESNAMSWLIASFYGSGFQHTSQAAYLQKSKASKFTRLAKGDSQVVFTGNATWHCILICEDGSIYEPFAEWRHKTSTIWIHKQDGVPLQRDYKSLTGKEFTSPLFRDGPEQLPGTADCMFYVLAYKWALASSTQMNGLALDRRRLRPWFVTMIDEMSVLPPPMKSQFGAATVTKEPSIAEPGTVDPRTEEPSTEEPEFGASAVVDPTTGGAETEKPSNPGASAPPIAEKPSLGGTTEDPSITWAPAPPTAKEASTEEPSTEEQTEDPSTEKPEFGASAAVDPPASDAETESQFSAIDAIETDELDNIDSPVNNFAKRKLFSSQLGNDLHHLKHNSVSVKDNDSCNNCAAGEAMYEVASDEYDRNGRIHLVCVNEQHGEADDSVGSDERCLILKQGDGLTALLVDAPMNSKYARAVATLMELMPFRISTTDGLEFEAYGCLNIDSVRSLDKLARRLAENGAPINDFRWKFTGGYSYQQRAAAHVTSVWQQCAPMRKLAGSNTAGGGGCFGEDKAASVPGRQDVRRRFPNTELSANSIFVDAGAGSGVNFLISELDKENCPTLILLDNSPTCNNVAETLQRRHFDSAPAVVAMQDVKENPEENWLHGVTHVQTYFGHALNGLSNGSRSGTPSDVNFLKSVFGNPTLVEYNTTKYPGHVLRELAKADEELNAYVREFDVVQIEGLNQRETRIHVWMYVRKQEYRSKSTPEVSSFVKRLVTIAKRRELDSQLACEINGDDAEDTIGDNVTLIVDGREFRSQPMTSLTARKDGKMYVGLLSPCL